MPESSAPTGLPAPYDRDPATWRPTSATSERKIAPGRRMMEGNAADKTLRARDTGGASGWDGFAPDELHRLLVLAAAAADAAALQSTHAPRHVSTLGTRAHLIASCLLDHDQDHGTGRGPIPAGDPQWITRPGDKHTPRAYLRQELAALLDAEAATLAQSSGAT